MGNDKKKPLSADEIMRKIEIAMKEEALAELQTGTPAITPKEQYFNTPENVDWAALPSSELAYTNLGIDCNTVRIGNWSRSQLYWLRKNGFKKPDDITQAEWFAPYMITHAHMKWIDMAVIGMKVSRIAEHFEVGEVRVREILNMPEVQLYIKGCRKQVIPRHADDEFLRLLPKAIQKMETLLDDENVKDSVKMEVAFRIVDRVMGRPMERKEVHVNLLAQVIEKIKTGSVSKKIEIPRDSFDDFVDKNVKEFKVGARLTGGGSDKEQGTQTLAGPVEESNSQTTIDATAKHVT